MKCAIYRYMALSPGGGKTMPVGDLYVCAHGTYVLTPDYRDPTHRATVVAAVQKLSTALQDMKGNPGGIAALLNTVSTDLSKLSWAVKIQGDSMTQTAQDITRVS